MSFTNLYYKRTAGTSKACYVCYKPTTTVLATVNTIDFLYTCPTHLKDSNFASQVGGSSDGTGPSAEEIAKVKAEWEKKQQKKAEKLKEKEKDEVKEKDGADKGGEEKNKDKDKDKENAANSPSPSKVTSPSGVVTPASTSTTPLHERYTLHRDFFAMRQAEHRRRRQAMQAKEIAPRLPSVPQGGL